MYYTQLFGTPRTIFFNNSPRFIKVTKTHDRPTDRCESEEYCGMRTVWTDIIVVAHSLPAEKMCISTTTIKCYGITRLVI